MLKDFLVMALGEKLWHILCAQFYEKLVYEATKYVCHCDLAIIVTTMGYVLLEIQHILPQNYEN